MNSVNETIAAMNEGNVAAILGGVRSEKPFIVLNAIMAGTKNAIKDTSFIEGVKNAEKDNTEFLGVPLCKFATASLHCLGVKEYKGSDKTINDIISTKFE